MESHKTKKKGGTFVEKRWLHLQLLGSDPWVLPVRNAINLAVRDGRMTEPGKEFNELCSNVSLRLSLLPRIAIRINKAWRSLSEAIGTREEWHEFTRSKQGYGFPWDQELTLDLVLDIDSFLFEIFASAELMDTLLKRAYKDTRTPFKKVGKLGLTRSVLQQEGKDVGWLDRVAELRNFFIHQATPYPAVELSSNVPELIVLRENVMYLDDDSKFVKLSELGTIVWGFQETKEALQNHLLGLYEGCNKDDSKSNQKIVDRPDRRYVITDEYTFKNR
jgi:hypothetical protein